MSRDRQTVLVVDDDASIRLLCRVNLELEGHRVLEAPTVPTARELIASEEIDFVILDVHVAGESGYDLIDSIRAQQRAPIALLTGSVEVTSSDRERVDAVLPKPFDLADLSGAITRLTGAAAEPG
jgi:DNA-binding response OmpR family regulator